MKNPPQIKIETLEQQVLSQGFLGIDRRKVKIIYPQTGPIPFEDRIMTIDSVVRKSNDAVAIIPHFELNRHRYIYLRSCLRPAAMLRDYVTDSDRPEDINAGLIWEIAAGLVDENERGESGLFRAAERELYEEIGLNVSVIDINYLGPRYFSSAGMCAERIWFFEVEVNPLYIEIPSEDGSALEVAGESLIIKLSDALQEVNNGNLVDSKTQMGIMRLAKKYNII